jgi:hypothetical protein
MGELVDAIEGTDKKVQHMVELLTQVDQSLREVKTELETFYADLSPKPPRIAKVAEACKDVEAVLGQMMTAHNSLVGDLRAAQEEAREHEAKAAAP